MKKKEDFLLHELILLDADSKIKNEKEEEIKKKKIETKKIKSMELEKILIDFLKENKESSFTINSLKTNINYKGRTENVKKQLEELCSKELVKSSKGKKGYINYQWNEDKIDKEEKQSSESSLIDKNESLTDEENNSDVGEHDYSIN